MKLKYKKTAPNAVTPFRLTKGSGGYDLTAISKRETENYIEFDTGIAVEIPKGYVGILAPRSSISNQNFYLKNSLGVIDSDYRDSMLFRFSVSDNSYNVGDRIGQLLVIPCSELELEEVEELTKTDRIGGFGSTGK